MLFTTLIKSLALLTLVNTTPTPVPYDLEVGTISGTYNDHAFEIQGDVQEVAAHLEALYGPLTTRAVEVERRASQNKVNNMIKFSACAPLQSLLTNSQDGVLRIPVRGQSWTWAATSDIRSGINMLNSIGGRFGVNGRSCARLSCTGRAGIYLCNDNAGTIEPGLLCIVSYASDIVSDCSLNPPFSGQIAGGQEFDSDAYNVIVREGC